MITKLLRIFHEIHKVKFSFSLKKGNISESQLKIYPSPNAIRLNLFQNSTILYQSIGSKYFFIIYNNNTYII